MQRILDVDNYQIYLNYPLGCGTNGSVYHCQNKKGEIFVAKVIKKYINYLVVEIEDDERVSNEMKILDVIKNSGNINLVRVYHFKRDESKFIQILEKCETNLSIYLNRRKKKSTYEEAIDFLNQIINGYRTFFEKNIIHRDIKPQNILTQTINNKIFFKFCDFGISKTLNSSNENLITQIGTPLYLAPEINRNYEQDKQLKQEFQKLVEKDFKEASKCDIFSIGILLYQFIFGELPHAKYHNKIDEFYLGLKKKEFEIDIDINLKLSQLIKKMIEYNPSERIKFDEILKNPLIIQQKLSNPIKVELPSVFAGSRFQSITSTFQLNPQPRIQSARQTQGFENQKQLQQAQFSQQNVASVKTTQTQIEAMNSNTVSSQQLKFNSQQFNSQQFNQQPSFQIANMFQKFSNQSFIFPFPNKLSTIGQKEEVQSLKKLDTKVEPPNNDIDLIQQKKFQNQSCIFPFPNTLSTIGKKEEVQSLKNLDTKVEPLNNDMDLIQQRIQSYFENFLYQTQKMIMTESKQVIDNFLKILYKIKSNVIQKKQEAFLEGIISRILLQMPERNVLKETQEYKKMRDDFEKLLNLLEFKISCYYEDKIIKKVKPNIIYDQNNQVSIPNNQQKVNIIQILNYFTNLLYEGEKMLDSSYVDSLQSLVYGLKNEGSTSLQLVKGIQQYLPERQQLQETSEYANFRNCFQKYQEWLQNPWP